MDWNTEGNKKDEARKENPPPYRQFLTQPSVGSTIGNNADKEGEEDDKDEEDDDEYVYNLGDDLLPSKRQCIQDMGAVVNNFDVSLYIEALDGGVEVIFAEKFNGDAAYLNHVRDELGKRNRKLLEMGIRAVGERVVKNDDGSVAVVKNKENLHYTKMVAVRCVNVTSSRRRRRFLEQLAEVSK